MAFNPLVFLMGGLGLLAATLTIAVLNRKSVQTDNPYDEHVRRGDLSEALWPIRHAEAHYRTGLELGARFPEASPERVARALERAGYGEVSVAKSARSVEWTVKNGPNAGVPQVDEPLCFLTLGILRGAFPDGRYLTGITEESCHGTGSPFCVFRGEVTRSDVRS